MRVIDKMRAPGAMFMIRHYRLILPPNSIRHCRFMTQIDIIDDAVRMIRIRHDVERLR